MPKKTKTTINQNSEGQYQTTIPKPLGDSMDLEGKKVEWDVVSSNSLKFRVVDDD
jgi:hypothetical protein